MDYYKVLGLTKEASIEDIKKAYRKLAMKHHPDRNKGDKISEDEFKKINEAYATLSDSTKRREYDAKSSFNGFHTHNGANSSGFRHTHFADENVDDFMRDFFNRGSFSDIFGSHFNRKIYSVTLNFWEAIFGTKKQFQIRDDNNNVANVMVQFPPGLDDGNEIEVHLEGGNKIYLNIRIIPDKNFTRDNLDLYTTIDIPLSKAMLGGTIKFPHWEKDFEINIPAGTQQGQLLRLSNAGIKKNIFSGDLYLKCNIVLPKKLTKKQKEILEEYAKTEKENTSFFDNLKSSWSNFFKDKPN